jgi:hypothetical protein
MVVRRPFDEIIEDLRIAGVGVAETFDAVCFEAAALGDPEAAGQIVLDPVELDQDIDLLRGARLGHLRDVPEGRAVEVVVPGHVDHEGPFCRDGGPAGGPVAARLARELNYFLLKSIDNRLVLGAMIKVVVGKKQRWGAVLVNSRQGLERLAKVFHPMEVMEFKWQDSIPCSI